MKVKKINEIKRNPEISVCALGGIVITNCDDDDIYAQSAYDTLAMIDECIDKSDFPFPHLKYTAQQRRNAGVGILGLAHHMARKGLKYDTPEGLAEINYVFERHAYFCIKASLRLAKERGVAPWMHRTKWPEGWLPIDTYNRNVDELVSPALHYPWEELRAEIIATGGIRHSSVCAMMPTESSSKASGAPNGPYPVRDLSLKKSDSANLLDWCAPDNDLLEDMYQIAWEIHPIDQIKAYGVMQKWTDQAISVDTYRDRSETETLPSGEIRTLPIKHSDLIKEEIALAYYGVKSEYYQNTFTVKTSQLQGVAVPEELIAVEETTNNKADCAGGACQL